MLNILFSMSLNIPGGRRTSPFGPLNTVPNAVSSGFHNTEAIACSTWSSDTFIGVCAEAVWGLVILLCKFLELDSISDMSAVLLVVGCNKKGNRSREEIFQCDLQRIRDKQEKNGGRRPKGKENKMIVS